jgi:hypothetical protein
MTEQEDPESEPIENETAVPLPERDAMSIITGPSPVPVEGDVTPSPTPSEDPIAPRPGYDI